MGRLFLSVSLLLISLGSFSQQNHFVYLQSYNNQPFYLRLNGKVLSSSATGYLIVPKLAESSYQFIIGFAKNEFPELSYNVTVKNNSGYELKNFPDKGWALYDLETTNVITGTPTGTPTPAGSVPKKNDAFADMLSTVVKDSTIRLDDSAALVNSKSKVVTETPVIQSIAATGPSVEIKRIMENITDDGIERIYLDSYGNFLDTVRLFIPGSYDKKHQKKQHKEIVNETAVSSPVSSELKSADMPPVSKAVDTTKDNSPKFLDEPPVKVQKPITEKDPGNSVLTMYNSDCHSIASEEDFFKLRKKMAAEKSDEDMIRSAKKAFKSKCYNTGYVKNLSVLFLTDQGRYAFFDAAYPFITDSQNFPSLEKELTDTYYINRFRAMIHK